MSGWKRMTPVVLVITFLAAACSGGGGSKKASTPSTSVGSVGGTLTATAPSQPGRVLATAKSTVGNFGSAQVDVLALQRAGEHVILRIAVTNLDQAGSCCLHIDAFTDPDQAKKDGDALSGAYLVDDVGAKKYFPLRDTDGNCVCSNHLPSITGGHRIELSATFPAPPRSVKVVTVSFSQFPAFPNIPISG
jgi:hypothetical protein